MLLQIGVYKKLKAGAVHLYKKYMPETDIQQVDKSTEKESGDSKTLNEAQQKAKAKREQKKKAKNLQGDGAQHAEQNNKREYLEKNLSYVTQNLEKNSNFHEQQRSKIYKENVTLLQEINSLKKEKHKLELEIREYEISQPAKNESAQNYESEEIQQIRYEND